MSKEKVQISPRQMIFLIITMVLSTADIFLPAFVAQEAKKDAWISVIISTIAIMAIMWILLKLYHRYEGMTIIEICRTVAGKPIGTVIGLLYAFFFLQSSLDNILAMTTVLNTAFLPLTPPWVLIVTAILVSLYAVSKDVEVIARINEMLLPIGIGALGFLVLVNINEMDLSFFMPILNEGFVPPLKGSLTIMGSFGELVAILQLVHFINKPKQLNKAVYIGTLVTGAGLLLGTLVYAVFGPLTEVFLMPALEFARYASIGEDIQNLDLIVMAIWITGIYVKVIIFYFVSAYALAQVFDVKNYKSLILPTALLIAGVALASEGRTIDILYYLHYIHPIHSMIIALIIPGILLVISALKREKPGMVKRIKEKPKSKMKENESGTSGKVKEKEAVTTRS